ncbi:MAG: AAA family ATPase, partial [Deltaproteobacteria bacterium]|nr:AAA family ATPase [Deltaproteobacteria bacterium]
MEKPRTLPIGKKDFRAIRERDYVYVDKTRIIHDLVQTDMAYFLSRPRRFGKSLLLSTMEHVFRGERGLFKGLWIDSSDYDWKPCPVIRLDMSDSNKSDPVLFESRLIR